MKKVICLILVLMVCLSFACTAYATGTDSDYVPSPGATEAPVDCSHDHSTVVGQKEASCTADGYTGDAVCDHCGKVIQLGQIIPKWGHRYVNGVCTVCGIDESNPQTGDNSFISLWIVVMVTALLALVAVTVVYRKKFANR